MKRISICHVLILSICFFLMSESNLMAQDIGVTDSSIKIGVFSNLTGAATVFGVPSAHGLMTVYNNVNKAGGIHGRKIEPIIIDDRCTPEGAKSAVKKLAYSDKVFCFNGGVCSLAMYGAAQDVIAAKIPIVILAATMDKISEPVSRYIFSPIPAASVDGVVLVDFLMSKPGTKRLALVVHDNEWARSKISKGLDHLKAKYGLDLVAKESIDPGATDATAQVLKIKQANPDGVLLVVYPAEAAVFCRDAYKYGLRVPFAGTSVIADLYDLRDRVGRVEPVMNVFSASSTEGSIAKYEDLRRSNANYYPSDKFNAFTLWGIGSARVTVEALKRAGRNLTRERFIEALETMKDFDTGVLSSHITFTKDDHLGCKRARMVTLVKGKEYYMEPKWVNDLKKWD